MGRSLLQVRPAHTFPPLENSTNEPFRDIGRQEILFAKVLKDGTHGFERPRQERQSPRAADRSEKPVARSREALPPLVESLPHLTQPFGGFGINFPDRLSNQRS